MADVRTKTIKRLFRQIRSCNGVNDWINETKCRMADKLDILRSDMVESIALKAEDDKLRKNKKKKKIHNQTIDNLYFDDIIEHRSGSFDTY